MAPQLPAAVELTEDEMYEEGELLTEDEAAAQERALREQTLDRLGQVLQTRKATAIEHKNPIEQRMLEDEARYWGVSYTPPSKDQIAAGETGHSGAPVDNKTRAKTRIAAARIGDMLFPTNSPNWALRPSPEPEVDPDLLELEYQRELEKMPPPAEGEPPQEPDIDRAGLVDKVAWRTCRRMERKIRDVLNASEYPMLGRAVIMDACKLGTGIVKGPYQRRRLRRKYKAEQASDGTRVDLLHVEVDTAPAVARTSPWMFFPQPARNMDECEWGFELHILNRVKLVQMVETHGFYPEQVSQVVERGPTHSSVLGLLSARAAITNAPTQYEGCWAIWEYHGPLDRQDLERLGIEVPDDEVAELTTLFGEVWMDDSGTVLRVNLSPLEADDSLPWNVFRYEEDETSVFGFGIPWIMRDDQFVIDMMWDALTHNAAVSSGPQTVITKGVLVPADGSFHIRGPKLWYNNDQDIKVGDAFQSTVVPSNISENMQLYEQAKTNADENTSLPLLLGDTLGANTTLPASGLAMLLNQQNIVQRQAAHSWDDNITSRLIGKMYHWFMQHDSDPLIKGDYEVEVRGASYLLVKDAQAQHAQLLIQMAAQDQALAQRLNLDELYSLYLGFMDIPVERLLKSKEQVDRELANQQPSQHEVLEMEKLVAETEELRARAMAHASKGQGEQGGPSADRLLQYEVEMAKLMDRQADRDAQVLIEQLRRDTMLMRVAADENVSYEKIRADMEKFYTKQGSEEAWRQRKQEADEFFQAAKLRLEEHRDRLKEVNLTRGYDTF